MERANADIKTMVTQWMEEEDSENWSWGIQFIAHNKYNCYHEGIKQILYVLRYGQPCRVGLSRMNLPPGLLSQLETEEDLDAVMAKASIITAPQAAAARAVQLVSTTAAAQAAVVEGQLLHCQSKKSKETAPLSANAECQPVPCQSNAKKKRNDDYQPGEYELKVIQKRNRNKDKMIELRLGRPRTAIASLTETTAMAEHPEKNLSMTLHHLLLVLQHYPKLILNRQLPMHLHHLLLILQQLYQHWQKLLQHC